MYYKYVRLNKQKQSKNETKPKTNKHKPVNKKAAYITAKQETRKVSCQER